jgi:hypothetical protein
MNKAKDEEEYFNYHDYYQNGANDETNSQLNDR